MEMLDWKSLIDGDGLDGWKSDDPQFWSRDGDSIAVDAAGVNEYNRLTYQSGNWSEFDFSVQSTLVHGANLMIEFGISDDHPMFYTLDWLRGMGKMALSSKVPGKKTNVRQLIEKQIEWKREYDVLLSIHGTSVKGSVDRQPVIELSIGEDLSGTIALATYGPHAIARFREPRIRTSVEVK